MDAPRLIDPSALYFLDSTLQKCHNCRVKLYTNALNIGVFFLFVIITGVVLYYCYKKKLTPYEAQQKRIRDQQYILSKIRYYQGENMNRKVSDITTLPTL
jgi:hypothetical protein